MYHLIWQMCNWLWWKCCPVFIWLSCLSVQHLSCGAYMQVFPPVPSRTFRWRHNTFTVAVQRSSACWTKWIWDQIEVVYWNGQRIELLMVVSHVAVILWRLLDEPKSCDLNGVSYVHWHCTPRLTARWLCSRIEMYLPSLSFHLDDYFLTT